MAEIKFRRDTAFRKQFFVPDSFAHPAKMDAQLLIWLVSKYTEIGETVADPMSGSGTTMLACMFGRNVVLVELEEKFCKMMRDNWELVKMKPQLGCQMGACQIIQGDARNLEGLLADKIITSPPYTDNPTGGGLNIKPPRDGHNDQSGRSPTSPSQRAYADKIITSPPYTNRMDGGFKGPRAGMIPYTDESPDTWPTQRDQTNLGNLPYGNIDSIITSPPYEGSLEGSGADAARKRISEGKYKGLRPDVWLSKGNVAGSTFGDGYSKSQNNIGNLKSDTYLEAMLQVYQQCFKVLKDGGLMVLVTKNFIRNKQIVRLDTDTIKLCEQAGFSYVERHWRKLPAQSFWRVIYHKKHPEVEQIKYEDILIFKK